MITIQENEEEMMDNKEELIDTEENSLENKKESIDNIEECMDKKEECMYNKEESIDSKEGSIDSDEESIDSKVESIDKKEESEESMCEDQAPFQSGFYTSTPVKTKPYECEDCQNESEYKDRMRNHVESHHGDTWTNLLNQTIPIWPPDRLHQLL